MKKRPITKTQFHMLLRGCGHQHGVVRPLNDRTGFERAASAKALKQLVEYGFITPNAHGDFYITEDGKNAAAELVRAERRQS